MCGISQLFIVHDLNAAHRELLGEIDDGVISFATSLANQKSILYNARTWALAVNDPRVFHPAGVATQDLVRIPGCRRSGHSTADRGQRDHA